jgi:RNA-directed DNA polymerase
VTKPALGRLSDSRRWGGERPLGIPTIRERCIGTAAKLVLEPIFEADLEPSAYGYRPKRSAVDAIRKVHRLLCDGYTQAVDADLSKYFDTIPHSDLLKCVARRIVDRDVLHLIRMWLKAPVESIAPPFVSAFVAHSHRRTRRHGLGGVVLGR